MKIHFLYGTETGSAEMLCEDMRDDLGIEAEITSLGDLTPADLGGDMLYMIVTSTYGNGDLPQMAAPFGEALEAGPDLAHVRFAIFGLGDMVFSETFNNGSQQLMDLMLKCGATMVGERGIYDASAADLPEDLGLPWAQGIVASLGAEAA